MEAPFRRARQPEQKEHRRQTLLAASRGLLEGGATIRDLSLNDLARHAGMAKANVYRYFESREALLLALLREEWFGWFADFRTQAPTLAPPGQDLRATVSAVARSLASRPLLCSLTASLPTVLEQNLSEETIRAFKEENLLFFAEIAGFLEARCPSLPAAAYAQLVRDIAHCIVGLHPSGHPAEPVTRVLEEPRMDLFRVDFGRDLERFALALALHAQHESGRG